MFYINYVGPLITNKDRACTAFSIFLWNEEPVSPLLAFMKPHTNITNTWSMKTGTRVPFSKLRLSFKNIN